MKNFRPVILWILILGIAFALWNNVSPKKSEQPVSLAVVKPNPQAAVSYVKKQNPSHRKETTISMQQQNPPAPVIKKKEQEMKSCLKEFGILSGYGHGKLETKAQYNFIPTIFRFGFGLGEFNKKAPVEFELEPFASAVTNPGFNAEYGSNFLLKFGYFITKNICPYIEGGAGIVYQRHPTVNVGGHVSFLPQAGAGFSYFINKNVAINVGYRYRHLSNAGIKEPNHGINVDMWLAGISWFFD